MARLRISTTNPVFKPVRVPQGAIIPGTGGGRKAI